MTTKNREQASSVCKLIFEEVTVKTEAKITQNQYREVSKPLHYFCCGVVSLGVLVCCSDALLGWCFLKR